MAPSRSLGSPPGPGLAPGQAPVPILPRPALPSATRAWDTPGWPGAGWAASLPGVRMEPGLRSLQGEGVGVPCARSQPLKKLKEPISLRGWNRSLPPSLIEVICCLGKRSDSSDTGCVSASPRVCVGTVLGSGHLERGLGTCTGPGLAALLFGVVYPCYWLVPEPLWGHIQVPRVGQEAAEVLGGCPWMPPGCSLDGTAVSPSPAHGLAPQPLPKT